MVKKNQTDRLDNKAGRLQNKHKMSSVEKNQTDRQDNKKDSSESQTDCLHKIISLQIKIECLESQTDKQDS